MNKRGQLAIFIILAIVIVVAIVGYFVVKSAIEGQEYVPQEVAPIADYLQDCTDQSFEQALVIVGMQGGYVLPEAYLETNLSDIAYGYYLGENTLVSLEEMEYEIEDYVEIVVPFCFNDSNITGFDIVFEESNADVVIEEGFVSLDFSYPFTATKAESTYVVSKNYESVVDVRLKEMHDAAKEIVNKEIENPDNISLSYLLDLDYDIVIMPYDDEGDILIYSLTDFQSIVNQENYTFMFANRLE
jgi:hypothetical protein